MSDYAIRWTGREFVVYLLWFHWKTKQWMSSPTSRRYKTLQGAIKHLNSSSKAVNYKVTIMIFPAVALSEPKGERNERTASL